MEAIHDLEKEFKSNGRDIESGIPKISIIMTDGNFVDKINNRYGYYDPNIYGIARKMDELSGPPMRIFPFSVSVGRFVNQKALAIMCRSPSRHYTYSQVTSMGNCITSLGKLIY